MAITRVIFDAMPTGVKQRDLTHDEEQLALKMSYDGKSMADIADKLGMVSAMAFYNYRADHPTFRKAIDMARIASCETLEDQVLKLEEQFLDPAMARVKLEALTKVLAFRDPARYSQRIDMNITQTIDISGVLERAERRVLPAIEVAALPLLSSKIDEVL